MKEMVMVDACMGIDSSTFATTRPATGLKRENPGVVVETIADAG